MQKLSTKIFIDGGVPEETKQANEQFQKRFGYPLDGQTTNPTLIAKNLQARLAASTEVLTEEKALAEYKHIVQEISAILPNGSVSIQVFANKDTKAEEMISQAHDRITWIPNASIKLPCTTEGIKAAATISPHMPINITLVFSQAQAAAVYEATKGTTHPVFLSPFVGRLDDRGENGMQLIENILRLYTKGDGHVETLTASVRNNAHITYAMKLGSPIMTLPAKVFTTWVQEGFPMPDTDYVYPSGALAPLPFDESITLGKPWESYDLQHPLTDKGLEAFWNDWQGLISL